MRITKIELNNIGVFEQESISFQPCPTKGKAEIHIFTGKNGSGKSTLLKCITAAFESIGVTPENTIVCTNDTNKLTKYMRYKNEKSNAMVCFDTETQSNCITYSHCDRGGNHVHISPNDLQFIIDYRISLGKQEKPEMTFPIAFFAYSGYRFLDFDTDSSSNMPNIKNPLYQSLEFIKKPNAAYSVNNWIKTTLLKRSYAQTEGLSHKKENFQDTINRIENALGEIIGTPVKFKLDNLFQDAVIIYNGQEHNFDVLPDGLKSIISWLADLCMRLDELKWEGDIPVLDRNIILFLDEIEVHLHVEWQRKILPIVQDLLPNAQIFISTHSPFVVNSVDDAWVYSLKYANNQTVIPDPVLSKTSEDVDYVLETAFGIKKFYGEATQNELDEFYALRDKVWNKEVIDTAKFIKIAKNLASKNLSIQTNIQYEMRQLARKTGEEAFIL